MAVDQWMLLLVAGAAAGVINTLIGAGSLITFPALLAAGHPPATANMINTVGLLPGTISGAYGLRGHLPNRQPFMAALCLVALTGAALGGCLLAVLPGRVFSAMAPWCILLASCLVAVQPLLQRRPRPWGGSGPSATVPGEPAIDPVGSPDAQPRTAIATLEAPNTTTPQTKQVRPWLLWPAVFLGGVYAGWIGISLGVVLLAVVALGLHGDLRQLNATKMLLACVTSVAAVTVFVATGHAEILLAAVPVGAGNVVGGWLGSLAAVRLPQPLLRLIMVTIGFTAAAAAF